MYTFFNPSKPEPSIRNNCPKRAKVTSLSGTDEFTSSKNTFVIVIAPPSESLLSQEVNSIPKTIMLSNAMDAQYFLFKIYFIFMSFNFLFLKLE
ncbi:hypothetical protein D3C80_1502450 [compost metagenome]